MKKYLCENCKKNEAEYRLTYKSVTIDVCDECSEKKKYSKYDSIPLDELEMDEDEIDGWEDLCDYYNK